MDFAWHAIDLWYCRGMAGSNHRKSRIILETQCSCKA